MAIERPQGLSLPDKVTVGLWNPEKAHLSQPQTRMLIDLFYCVDALPAKSDIRISQYHSFVFLAQEFGAVDTHYEFKDGDTTDPMSGDLAEDLHGCLGGVIKEDKIDQTWSLSPKYRELIETVGGPVTVHNQEIIRKLVALAGQEKLVRLGAYVWLQKEGANLDGWYKPEERAVLAALEKELRGIVPQVQQQSVQA